MVEDASVLARRAGQLALAGGVCLVAVAAVVPLNLEVSFEVEAGLLALVTVFSLVCSILAFGFTLADRSPNRTWRWAVVGAVVGASSIGLTVAAVLLLTRALGHVG